MTNGELFIAENPNIEFKLNEAYKQIMIAAQDENEVSDVLDKIRAEIQEELKQDNHSFYRAALEDVLKIIDKYRNEVNE